MYSVQIPGNTFPDNFNRAYLQSLSPDVIALWAGSFGLPGPALNMNDRLVKGSKLAAGGAKVTQADLTGMSPYAWMAALMAGGYAVFSYVGEPNPDWATTRPGDPEPGVPDYNPQGHTGVVSFALPAPYSGPIPATVLYVGGLADRELALYNSQNGAENKFNIGDSLVEGGMLYVWRGKIGPVFYWQLIGRA